MKDGEKGELLEGGGDGKGLHGTKRVKDTGLLGRRRNSSEGYRRGKEGQKLP